MSILSFLVLFLQLTSSTTLALNYRLTAISANQKKESTIECWELCTPISVSSQPGISGAALQALGPIANASVAILPPHFDGGLHNAPFYQYVILTPPSPFCVLTSHIKIPRSARPTPQQKASNTKTNKQIRSIHSRKSRRDSPMQLHNGRNHGW